MAGQNVIVALILFGSLFGAAVIIAVSMFWLDHRTRKGALDVLRAYAERGDEPPASVVQAVTAVSGWGRHAGASPQGAATAAPSTRANHLAHAAANAVTVAGLGYLWRLAAAADVELVAFFAFIGALFFAASLAARLVGAYYARQTDER